MTNGGPMAMRMALGAALQAGLLAAGCTRADSGSAGGAPRPQAAAPAAASPRDGPQPKRPSPPLLPRDWRRPYLDWSAAETAAEALARIGSDAVPPLVELLDRPEPEVRRRAAEVLAKMGPLAAPAAPRLAKMLDDPDPDVRKAAAWALGQIGPEARAAIPDLLRLLETEDAAQR